MKRSMFISRMRIESRYSATSIASVQWLHRYNQVILRCGNCGNFQEANTGNQYGGWIELLVLYGIEQLGLYGQTEEEVQRITEQRMHGVLDGAF